MHITKKAGLAAGLVLAIFLTMANPAAAGGPFPIRVTAGTLKTVLGDFDLTPGGDPEPPCKPQPGTLALSTDNDATPPGVGNWSVSGGYKGQFQILLLGTDWYQADFSITGGGTYAPGGPPQDFDLFGNLDIDVDIYFIGDEEDPNCVKDDFVCTISAELGITDGRFFGTLPNSNVGDYAVIDAATTSPLTVSSPCGSVFPLLANSNAAVNGLTLEHV